MKRKLTEKQRLKKNEIARLWHEKNKTRLNARRRELYHENKHLVTDEKKQERYEKAKWAYALSLQVRLKKYERTKRYMERNKDLVKRRRDEYNKKLREKRKKEKVNDELIHHYWD